MTAGSRRSPWNPAPAPMRSVLLSGMERRSGELAGRPLAAASIAAQRAAVTRPLSPPTPLRPRCGEEAEEGGFLRALRCDYDAPTLPPHPSPAQAEEGRFLRALRRDYDAPTLTPHPSPAQAEE